MGRKERFVSNMRKLAEDDSHGYSQRPPSGRWGPDYDCGTAVYTAADEAGYPVGTGQDTNRPPRWTGQMAKDFSDAGFQLLPFANVGIDGLKIGDILLNLAVHAEVYLGDGNVAGAQGSETGGYTGKAGDQTGSEITIQPVYTHSHGWNYVLRPPDDVDEDGPDDISEEGEEMPYNNGYMNPNQGYPQYNGYQPMRTTTVPYTQGNMTYPQGNQQWNGYSQPRMPSFGGQQGYQQGNLGYQQPQMGMQGISGLPQQNQGYPQSGGGMMGLCMANGVEEAYSYLQGLENGQAMPCFDWHKDMMYICAKDAHGVPSLSAFKLEEVQEEMPQHGDNLIGRLVNRQMRGAMGYDQQQSYGMGQQGMEPQQPAGNAQGGNESGNPQANGGVNYANALNTAQLTQAIQAEGNATRAMFQQDKYEQLQMKYADLNQRMNTQELQDSIRAATANVVRYPNGFVYNAGPSPFCGNGCGNMGGCCNL